MTRDMSVFDAAERDSEVFGAVLYLKRTTAQSKRRRIVALTSVAVFSGIVGAVAFNTRLLLAGGDYSLSSAAAVAAAGTIPLLLGVGAYLAGLKALQAVDADLARVDPGPYRTLLGVVDPPEEPLRSSAKSTSGRL